MQSGYIRADYDRPELHRQTVNGDTDLFGDGLIRLVETRATPPASRPAGLATRPIAPPRGVESTLPQGIDLQSTDGAAGAEHKPPRHAARPSLLLLRIPSCVAGASSRPESSALGRRAP
jgi:hypothetical protein